MGVAAGAEHLGPAHAESVIGLDGDVLLRDRLVKTRPAGTGIELGTGIKQRRAATDTAVHAGLVVVPKLAAEGALGAFLAGNIELFLGELLFPVGIGFLDLVHGHDSFLRSVRLDFHNPHRFGAGDG